MTLVSCADVKFEEIEWVEVGAEGVRVTFLNGERRFVGGEVGFELYRKWTEGRLDGGGVG
jgi:hypothetical protein